MLSAHRTSAGLVSWPPRSSRTVRVRRFLAATETLLPRGDCTVYIYVIRLFHNGLNCVLVSEQHEVWAVQYFECARYEYHPENDPPFDVLLGLLGNQLVPRKG